MATFYRHWFPCTVTPENPHGKGYTGRTYGTVEKRDKARFQPSAVKDSVALKRAIVKYGKENMQTDIIESDILPIKEVVDEREKYWIAHFGDFGNGYNLTKGGDGFQGFFSEESKKKLSISMKKSWEKRQRFTILQTRQRYKLQTTHIKDRRNVKTPCIQYEYYKDGDSIDKIMDFHNVSTNVVYACLTDMVYLLEIARDRFHPADVKRQAQREREREYRQRPEVKKRHREYYQRKKREALLENGQQPNQLLLF